MSGIIVGSGLVLVAGTDYDANNPIVGYENLVTSANVTADSEDADYPATNLANANTALLWKALDVSPVGDIYITAAIDTVEQVDYVAIARHNLGSGLVPISVEGLVDDAPSPTEWVELVSERILPDDGPAMFCFTAASYYAIRLRLQQSTLSTVPQIAVMYTGKTLMLPRRIYVPHVPAPYARSAKIVSNRSESGDFLGRIKTSQRTSIQVEQANLLPAWVRSDLWPFILAAQESPFFFAWRPGDYPFEIGYLWMTNDPAPANQHPNGMMQISMEMAGIA